MNEAAAIAEAWLRLAPYHDTPAFTRIPGQYRIHVFTEMPDSMGYYTSRCGKSVDTPHCISFTIPEGTLCKSCLRTLEEISD